MDLKKYTDYIMDAAVRLLAVDSPTGYTEEAADWVMKEFESLGYTPVKTVKGGVCVDLGGKDDKDGLLDRKSVV